MCGIAVAIDWDGAEAAVRRLVAGLQHRGDVTDPLLALGSRIAMCTRRLRIVDAENGTQPVASHDGRILVAFNGEIYHHADLRGEMQAFGIGFRTECDTEVVANLLQFWGPAAIRRLNGMFAFVAIDTATGHFLAARDSFGVKPLYLIRNNHSYLFCSEMRPLLDAADGDVLLLPPGRMLGRAFYGPHYLPPEAGRSRPATPHALDSVLAEAVDVRLPPGLPVAALFSGGIDSTLIVHYARRCRPDLRAYIAIGEHSPDYDYARRYADATGLDLREVVAEPFGAGTASLIDAVVDTVETFEPAVVRPGVHTYRVSKAIHDDGFRVALCGEGADELFAGYEPLEMAFAGGTGRDARNQCLSMMHRANLQRVDRCSMRFQLEIREPFLDQRVVAYANGLDESVFLERSRNVLMGKAPLRALYDMYPADLPVEIRNRQKVAFHEGVCASMAGAGWLDLFETEVSDADFRDGRREFSDFQIATKEELFFIRTLAKNMDISRVPHLRSRLKLVMREGAGCQALAS